MKPKNYQQRNNSIILVIFLMIGIITLCPIRILSQDSSEKIYLKLFQSIETKNLLPYKAKFSVDGKFLFCEAMKGTFDPKTGKMRIEMEEENFIYDIMNNAMVRTLFDTKVLGFNYKNEYLIEKEGIVLCDLNDGKEIAKISESPVKVVVSLDGKYAALIVSNEKIFIYDFVNNQAIEELNVANFSKDIGGIYLIDNKTLLQLFKGDNGLILKDVINDKVVNNFPCKNSNLVNIAYSPNGVSAAACCADSIYIWNILEQNSLKVKPFPHTKGFNAFNFSRDGMLIGAGSASMELLFYDRKRDELILNLNFHIAPITDVLFSPVDDVVATTSFDGTMKIWNIERH